ncbi:MAG: hypothetical protein V3U16_04670 [Candidatus Neomarinimicrobiota bacterium]
MSAQERLAQIASVVNGSFGNGEFQSIFKNPPVSVIKESTTNNVSFNVMPDRPVEEKLHVREYRIWDSGIEAIFDRSFHTTMDKSPSHLTFITALIHMQKMLYVYMCHDQNIEYDPFKPEKLKIWPTILSIDMPKLVTKSENISHKMWIKDVSPMTKSNHYLVTADTVVGDYVFINGQALVIKL